MLWEILIHSLVVVLIIFHCPLYYLYRTFKRSYDWFLKFGFNEVHAEHFDLWDFFKSLLLERRKNARVILGFCWFYSFASCVVSLTQKKKKKLCMPFLAFPNKLLFIREAKNKVFFSGRTTKALPPPLQVSVHKIFW